VPSRCRCRSATPREPIQACGAPGQSCERACDGRRTQPCFRSSNACSLFAGVGYDPPESSWRWWGEERMSWDVELFRLLNQEVDASLARHGHACATSLRSYRLPLLLGLAWVLWRGPSQRRRNRAGLDAMRGRHGRWSPVCSSNLSSHGPRPRAGHWTGCTCSSAHCRPARSLLARGEHWCRGWFLYRAAAPRCIFVNDVPGLRHHLLLRIYVGFLVPLPSTVV